MIPNNLKRTPNLAMPEFDNPPVVEVACSIQFTPLTSFQTPYAGFLWQEFREKYPKFEEKSPLPHVVEKFPEPNHPIFQAGFSDLPPPRRVFFLTEDGRHVIQIQPDSFVHNWRKVEDEDEYPRYVSVCKQFLEDWDKFLAFSREQELGEVSPDQYELTYVNHFVQGRDWSGLADLGRLLRDVQWDGHDRFLPIPERILLRCDFPMEDQTGRLHSTLKQGKRMSDGTAVLILQLTARGFPGTLKSQDPEAMLSWFDMAHEWIVRGFTDLTAEWAQTNLWKRRK